MTYISPVPVHGIMFYKDHFVFVFQMGIFTEDHALFVDTLLIGGLFLLQWYIYKLLLAPLFSPLRKVPNAKDESVYKS